MKIRYCIAIVFLTIAFTPFCLGQEKVKFGKISPEELKMEYYENDSAASAVVLYEELNTLYEYDRNSLFKVVNHYFVRIKILTNEGLSQADQSVSRYIGSNNLKKEILSGLSGNTYNLVNGKVEQTKLSKEHIFEEKTSEHITRTKFAFQSVKPGSVIEYKYELTSPFYWELNDYYFQRSIPVKFSKYYLQIPDYISFNKETRGTEKISLKQTKENKTMLLERGTHSYTSDIYDFTAENLPGLKDEDYVWSIKDYLTRITFEIQSFVIPGVIHETFSTTWEKVDEKLLENNDFGKQFNHKLFKDELETLFTPEMSNTDKTRAIFAMVKNRVKWNDKNTFWAENPKEALKKGLGTSGEINALLISAFREAGFDAYPIAMRKRNTGRMTIAHPTIDNFNYFIAAVNIDDKVIYMDASAKYGDLNVMSPNSLSDVARSIKGNRSSSWLNLTGISKSSGTISISSGFNEEGLLSGKVTESTTEQLAYSLRESYFRGKDGQEFFDKKAASQNMEIPSYSVKNMEMEESGNSTAYLDYEFIKKDVMLGDEFIYFNPLIIPLYEENPFKSEDRKLPVEFLFPYYKRQIILFDVPEGYEVEELPKSTKISFGDNDEATYLCLITNDTASRRVSFNIRFTLNKIIYMPTEYALLRDFFLHISTNNTQQIVLKKVGQ